MVEGGAVGIVSQRFYQEKILEASIPDIYGPQTRSDQHSARWSAPGCFILTTDASMLRNKDNICAQRDRWVGIVRQTAIL